MNATSFSMFALKWSSASSGRELLYLSAAAVSPAALVLVVVAALSGH